MKEQLFKYLYKPESEAIVNKYIQLGWIVTAICTNHNSAYVFILFEREKQVKEESSTQILRGQDMHNGENYEKQ